MRWAVGFAGLVASLCVVSAAEAAPLVSYKFVGLASGTLNGAAFSDAGFDLVLHGDPALLQDPYGSDDIFQISPLADVVVHVSGFGEGVLAEPLRLSVVRSSNLLSFGKVFGVDYLDLQLTDSEEQAFDFAAGYGPVSGAASTFGQFTNVSTSLGTLSVTEVHSVHFSTTLAPVTAPVPEPGAWALMILGFGGAGAALRRRRAALA